MRSQPIIATRRRVGLLERALAMSLLLLMAAGSLALWIVIPAFAMSILMPISGSLSNQILLALTGVPLAMVLFAALLFWVNGLYLRVTGQLPDDDEDGRRLRGPLEPLLAWSFVIALVALIFWCFFIPHGVPRTVI